MSIFCCFYVTFKLFDPLCLKMLPLCVVFSVLAAWFSVECNPSPVLGDVVVDRYEIPKDCAREAKTGDYVRYHYNATFTDGKALDSSYEKGAAKVGLIGEGRLIAGVDKGLQGMCVNERRKITIPPHLAYGSSGAGDVD
ncbi:peptidyl-prolyl cis-trans isomerase FKBP10-like [Gambusia affinis]|uniref:peptidyl-prolyl cis-trans isomerase FKBP10-like n=1 Tax=Gambusia affinis TaxID=33528 RepID=UPI001CDB6820|nr:peptidyl-prolyl cis-trans isomerase FKBP10-like [Gambusia affinis]